MIEEASNGPAYGGCRILTKIVTFRQTTPTPFVANGALARTSSISNSKPPTEMLDLSVQNAV